MYTRLLNLYIASRYLGARLRSLKLDLKPGNFNKHIYIMPRCSFENYRKIDIGKYVFINRNTTFSTPHGIKIGNFVMIGPNSLFASVHHRFDDHKKPMFFQKPVIKPIIIEDDVWISANVTVLGSVRIGRGSVIAAGAVVTRDVKPFSIVGGVPAKHIKYRFDSKTRKKAMKVKLEKYTTKNSLNIWA